MDDDDDCLFDLIGDPQALNYFLHGPGSKSDTDSKSSVKGLNSQLGDGSSDGLQLSSSLQFLEEDLETNSLPDVNEDQPFDILQKSLEEANITEQTLAEGAYLDADVDSSQAFSQPLIHPSSSASCHKSSDISDYSGQTLHPIGVPVGESYASNTVGLQQGFMHHVEISVANQQLSNCNQLSGSGQIQLISPYNNQPSMMTINNIDGSHILFKGSGQQASANMGAGVLVQRHMPNGNSMFGGCNSNPVGQTMSVPFNNANFQTSLPVQNIIIQRGLAPNANKIPINIQPKSLQMDPQTTYNMNHLGTQQHHIQQGIQFASSNLLQNSPVGQQLSVNIGNQQNPRKLVPPQQVNNTGNSMVIHSSMGHHHAHQNQFLIPTCMSLTSNSNHHVQTINGPLMQAQQTHIIPTHVSTDNVTLNRNCSSMIRCNQPYSGQMMGNQNTSTHLVSGQTYTSPGCQFIMNHGSSQVTGGQIPMQQVSPAIVHLSPSQGNIPISSTNLTTSAEKCPGIAASHQFTVVNSGTIYPSVGSSGQMDASRVHMFADQLTHQTRNKALVNVSQRLPVSSSQSTNTFVDSPVTYSCCQPQKNPVNQPSPVSFSQNQDGLRPPQPSAHASNISSSSSSAAQGTGCKMLQPTMGTSLLQQEKSLSLQQNMQVEGYEGGIKRSADKQLTKGALLLQRLNKDQACVEVPDKRKFSSLNDAVDKLLPYHVFQGSMPNKEDLQKVDNEFECAASHLLQRTQAMLNKYRQLLFEDAMRVNPSAEIVMIDRMFNQEERAALTREKRSMIVDPDGYLAEFCCSSKFLHNVTMEIDSVDEYHTSNKSETSISRKPRLQRKDHNASNSTELTKLGINNLVPNNTAPFHKSKTCHTKSANPCKDSSSEKVNYCLEIKNMNETGEDTGPMNLADSKAGCSESKVLSGRLAKPEKATNILPCDSIELNTGTQFMHSLQTNISSEDLFADSMKCTKSSQQEVSLTKSLENTLTNKLELKKHGKHLRCETDGCRSADLDFSDNLPLASQENCQEKLIPDQSQGFAEADSVLEAAVNSILEC